jgi:hypothetical protein
MGNTQLGQEIKEAIKKTTDALEVLQRDKAKAELWLRTYNMMDCIFYPEFFCDFMDEHPIVRTIDSDVADIHDRLRARLGRHLTDDAIKQIGICNDELRKQLRCENNMSLSAKSLDQAWGVFYGTADYEWVKLIAHIAQQGGPCVPPVVRAAAIWSLGSHIDQGVIDKSTLGAPAAAPIHDRPRTILESLNIGTS